MALDSSLLPGTPLPEAAPVDTCTLVVALRDSPGALGRIAATLGSTPVLALSYVVTGPARALAEIRLERGHAPRARRKLSRMVDTTYVSEPTALPPTRSS
ncbi:hypothetical protein [Streptomyces sp. NPDC085479]|uniref:hypothetical protein n=1 Tax=Streptomyces sp. NPDC085479 TaxID=3365726 RepID=UPI0037CD111F